MTPSRRVPALIPFLIFVSLVFIGILIYVYAEAKKANPQMLDERGRVKVGQTSTSVPPAA